MNTPSEMSIWKGVFNGAWMLVLVWGLKEGMTIYEEGFLAVPIWNYALVVVGLIFVGGFAGALYAVARNAWMR